MTPLLTIAIPTRNRAPFLRECLSSIRAQGEATGRIEVLVSDNASTDDTEKVIEDVRAAGLPVGYTRQPQDVGFDRNFEEVVGRARGTFTWVIGDDDWIEPGGLTRVLELLAAYPDTAGLTIECAPYRADGRAIGAPTAGEAVRAFTPARAALLDRTVPHHICNLTLNVFRTSRAHGCIGDRPLARGGVAAHDLVLRVIAASDQWVYAGVRAAAWRYGNDGFMEGGLLKRAEIALRSYPENIRSVFGENSDVYHFFMGVVLPPLARNFVLRSKNVPRYNRYLRPYHCGRRERAMVAWESARALSGRRAFWTIVAPTIATPRPLLALYARLRDEDDAGN